MILALLEGSAVVRQQVDRPVDDDAAPVERTLDLIDLEGHVPIVREGLELRAIRAPQKDPSALRDVADRLDVHDLTIDECEPADVVVLEHVGAVFRRENEELWLLHGEQAAAGCREAARK